MVDGRPSSLAPSQAQASVGISFRYLPIDLDPSTDLTYPHHDGTGGRLSGALHVYGGDFFAMERSEWEPETHVEGRDDAQKTMRHFEQANARS